MVMCVKLTIWPYGRGKVALMIFQIATHPFDLLVGVGAFVFKIVVNHG